MDNTNPPDQPQAQEPNNTVPVPQPSVPPPPVETPAQTANTPVSPSSEGPSAGAGTNKSKLFLIAGVGIVFGAVVFGLIFQRLNVGEVKRLGVDTAPAIKKQVIKIGTDATYPPMEFEEGGQLVGFDIDLSQKLSEEMGVDYEIQKMSWDSLFTALESGQIDLIISSVTITEERKEKYDFSEPYFNAGQVIVTKKEDTSIKTPQNLSNKRVGVQKDTTSQAEGERYASGSALKSYEDYVEAVQALNVGSIDAIIIDLTGAKGLIDDNPNLKIASDPFTNEFYGIVLKKGNTSLVDKVNQGIYSLRDRGILDNIKQKWFQ